VPQTPVERLLTLAMALSRSTTGKLLMLRPPGLAALASVLLLKDPPSTALALEYVPKRKPGLRWISPRHSSGTEPSGRLV
jgi:hypothetical protein